MFVSVKYLYSVRLFSVTLKKYAFLCRKRKEVPFMLKAICTNPHVFRAEKLRYIINHTGAVMDGYTNRNMPVNCIEAYADGRLAYACCWPQLGRHKGVVDCRGDIEKFIFIVKDTVKAFADEKTAQ